MQVIRDELTAVRDQYADPRRTEIIESQLDLTLEDLISEEDVVVTLSHAGYAKSQPLSAYRAQRRGGKGKSATAVKDEDFVDRLLIANTHDTILCFSSAGKVYWLKVYQIPQAGRGRITSYNVCYTKLLRLPLPLSGGERHALQSLPRGPGGGGGAQRGRLLPRGGHRQGRNNFV